MRRFNKHHVLAVVMTLAIVTSVVGQVNAQLITADLKNLKALTETAVTAMSLIIQNFGFSPDQKLDFEASFTDSDWSLTIRGAYLTLPVELFFSGSFNEGSNRGLFSSGGRIGPSNWTGSGSYRLSDIGSKGFSMILESEARIDNRKLDIHVRKHWTFQRKGKHVVSEDIGTVQLTENGRPVGRPLRERSFDIFGITPPRTGTIEITIADGSFLKGTFNLDSKVSGSVQTVATLAQAQEKRVLDDFKCYFATGSPDPKGTFKLEDEFFELEAEADVTAAKFFCNPVDKNGLGIIDRRNHLTWYMLDNVVRETKETGVVVRNQFFKERGTLLSLRDKRPKFLAVPTEKENMGEPSLDHYLCYEVSGKTVTPEVTLRDQFDEETQRTEQQSEVEMRPDMFCSPVKKNQSKILRPLRFLTCYTPLIGEFRKDGVKVKNQFESQTLNISNPNLLCVPSIVFI